MRAAIRKLAPGSIGMAAILAVLLPPGTPEAGSGTGWMERLELRTYDWRVRLAAGLAAPSRTPLAMVLIDDHSLKLAQLQAGVDWPWPRRLHGQLLKALTSRGAATVAFDILFDQLRPTAPVTELPGEVPSPTQSDDAFALQLRQAGNCVLATFGESVNGAWQAIAPADLFRTNAAALGHVTIESDADGVRRRVKAWRDDPQHGRIWHLGIVLAARHLGIDLSRAQIEPRRVIFQDQQGDKRVIPIDREGCLLIDWSLPWEGAGLLRASAAEVLGLTSPRQPGAAWAGRLVVIGSTASGQGMADVGVTPLGRTTQLVCTHLNVADSIIACRSVRATPAWLQRLTVGCLGLISAWLAWHLSGCRSLLAALALTGFYLGMSLVFFVCWRIWLPVILPLGGGVLATHLLALGCRLLTRKGAASVAPVAV
jgi:CHASE2 domain-containing sensor protein